MQKKKRMFLTGVGVFFLFLVSCGQNPVSTPPTSVDGVDQGTVKLSIKGIDSNTSAAKNGAQLNKLNGGLVTITSARVVIEKIELENSQNSAFDFKFNQPFVQDLVSITNLMKFKHSRFHLAHTIK